MAEKAFAALSMIIPVARFATFVLEVAGGFRIRSKNIVLAAIDEPTPQAEKVHRTVFIVLHHRAIGSGETGKTLPNYGSAYY